MVLVAEVIWLEFIISQSSSAHKYSLRKAYLGLHQGLSLWYMQILAK